MTRILKHHIDQLLAGAPDADFKHSEAIRLVGDFTREVCAAINDALEDSYDKRRDYSDGKGYTLHKDLENCDYLRCLVHLGEIVSDIVVCRREQSSNGTESINIYRFPKNHAEKFGINLDEL